jgi:hypothetical protein
MAAGIFSQAGAWGSIQKYFRVLEATITQYRVPVPLLKESINAAEIGTHIKESTNAERTFYKTDYQSFKSSKHSSGQEPG